MLHRLILRLSLLLAAFAVVPAAVGPIAAPAHAQLVAPRVATLAARPDFITLTAPVWVGCGGDSQWAGRGVALVPGMGGVYMDGARAGNVCSRLVEQLRALGYQASAESFAEAANTGGTIDTYDPRVSRGSFAEGTSGNSLGGYPFFSSSGTTPMTFKPPTPIDTCELFTLRSTSITGQIDASLDGGTSVSVNENGVAANIKSILTAPLGIHTLAMARNATVGGQPYVQRAFCYNSTAKDFRIDNFSARGWGTPEYLTNDQPYRAFGGIRDAVKPGEIVIVPLGGNDLGGDAVPLGTYNTNYRALIEQYQAAGAYPIVAVQMPISATFENTFTFAQMVATEAQIASDLNLPFFRGDLVLGPYDLALTNHLVVDTAHWTAPASILTAKALVPYILQGVRDIATKPLNTVAPAVAKSGGTLSVSSNGSWTNTPTRFEVTWLRDGALIAGQASASYAYDLSVDAGHSLAAIVKASNAAGSGPARRSNQIFINAATGTVMACDSFDSMADGSLLQGRTAPTGGSWLTTTSVGFTASGGAVYGGGGARALIPGTGMLASTNYYVQATFVFKSALPGHLTLRYQNGTNYIYCGYSSTNGGWLIGKLVNNVATTASSVSAYTPAANDNHVVRCADNDTGAVVLTVDGVTKATATITDAALAPAGGVGLYTPSNGASDATHGIQFDNLTAVAN